MMQRGGFVPAFMLDMLIQKNGSNSIADKLMRKIESRLGAPIYSSTTSKPNQTGSGLRRRRISRKKKRATKKRVTKKRNGIHSRRIM
jgi:hypothetical protein